MPYGSYIQSIGESNGQQMKKKKMKKPIKAVTYKCIKLGSGKRITVHNVEFVITILVVHGSTL